MSQPLRREDDKEVSLMTSKTLHSRIWLANNEQLEEQILGYLAKYVEKHEVKLYASVFQGNHLHIEASFPLKNRARFAQDFNARTSESVKIMVHEFPGGPLYARRYCSQAVLRNADIEDKFFYCALQAVNSGLCENISDYPGYNSFHSAICGITETHNVISWGEYNKKRKRKTIQTNIADYTTSYQLKYERLPGYEDLSQEEYKKLMLKRLEERRQQIVSQHILHGRIYKDPSWLKEVKPGSYPVSTKSGGRRPKCICGDPELKREYLEALNQFEEQYKAASKQYLAGNEFVEFPPNCYKPARFFVNPKPENSPPK